MKNFLFALIAIVFTFSTTFADSPLPQPQPVKFVEPAVPDVKFLVSGIETGDIEQGKSIPIGDTVVVSLKFPDVITPPVPEELIKKGKVSTSMSMAWEVKELIVSNSKGKEVKRKFKALDGDKSVSFGTGTRSTDIQIECIVTWLFVVQEETSQKFIIAKTVTSKYLSTVTIGQMPKPPPVVPDPANPDPSIPNGTLGIGQKVYNLIQTINESVKKDAVKALKESTVKTLNEANAGKFNTSKDLLKGWGVNNSNEAVNINTDAVDALDQFSTDLQPLLIQLYKDKKLVSIEDYKNLLSDIIAVLDKVK